MFHKERASSDRLREASKPTLERIIILLRSDKQQSGQLAFQMVRQIPILLTENLLLIIISVL